MTTMTSTTAPATIFEIFSRTTGHSFGVWEADTAEQALMQMEEQAGEIDRSDLECVPTAECIQARRARSAEFAGKAFFAAMGRRYDAETDALEAARVAVMGSRA